MNIFRLPSVRVENAFFKLLEKLMVVLLTAMVVMVFGNVVLRYLFDSGIDVSEELSRYVFVWLTFIGAVVVRARTRTWASRHWSRASGRRAARSAWACRGRARARLLRDLLLGHLEAGAAQRVEHRADHRHVDDLGLRHRLLHQRWDRRDDRAAARAAAAGRLPPASSRTFAGEWKATPAHALKRAARMTIVVVPRVADRRDGDRDAGRLRAAGLRRRADVAPEHVRQPDPRAEPDHRRRQLPAARGAVLPARRRADERGRPVEADRELRGRVRRPHPRRDSATSRSSAR